LALVKESGSELESQLVSASRLESESPSELESGLELGSDWELELVSA